MSRDYVTSHLMDNVNVNSSLDKKENIKLNYLEQLIWLNVKIKKIVFICDYVLL